MNKIAVVYWTCSGNTEIMANCITDGARAAGATVSQFTPADFSAADLDSYDVVAFGCPAMGAETLEESEFEPMFSDLEGQLKGRKIALFGSYGWGDGQWMRDWYSRCADDGATLFGDEGLIVNETPDDAAEHVCSELGRELASW